MKLLRERLQMQMYYFVIIVKLNKDLIIYMYEEWFEKIAKKLEVEKSKQTKTFIELELSENISKKMSLCANMGWIAQRLVFCVAILSIFY